MVLWLSTPLGTMVTLWTGRGSGESTGGCRRRNSLVPLLHIPLHILLHILLLPNHIILPLHPCFTHPQTIGRHMTVKSRIQLRASMFRGGDSTRPRRRHTPRRPTPVMGHRCAVIAVTTAARRLSTPHGRIPGTTGGRLSVPKMT